MYLGVDTAQKINAEQAQKLHDNGVDFVVRYLVPNEGSTAWKAVTAEEIATIHNAGMAVGFVWETTAQRVKGGASAGAEDGWKAKNLATELGIPSASVIYFACDYDIPKADLQLAEDYYRSARIALGKYLCGVYGGQRICTEMFHKGFLHLWQCVAWSNEFLQRAEVIQYAWQGSQEAQDMATATGVAVDLNRANTLEFMWQPPIEKRWYTDAVKWAQENELINGEPTDTATKADLASMFFYMDKRLSGLLE